MSSFCNTRNRGNTAWAGLFYTTAKGKYGVVAQSSSKEAHKDYVVQPPWVLNMMGMGKLCPEAARGHMVMQARDLPRLLSSMDAYILERRNLALESHKEKVLGQLHSLIRPFVKIPAVEEWVEDHQELRWRYKFLVLVGSSMMGKQGMH